MQSAVGLILTLLIAGCLDSGPPLARVRHLTRLKIVESNNVALRPGSVYDAITYFESYFGVPYPPFLYEFVDTGLGTAEPLYPNYQEGWQVGWPQLIQAWVSEESRHIDHFSALETKEHCFVTSLYMLRHISEFPERFVKDRAAGYDKIVIRLDHYTRLVPDAECGRHVSHPPDPDFDPLAWLRAHRDVATLADFPQDDLARFEANVSVIRHLDERFVHGDEHRRFDRAHLADNTLWYYPDGHEPDYGLRTVRPQGPLHHVQVPRDLVFSPPETVRATFGLDRMLSDDEYGRVVAFLNGEPVPGYRTADEPGNDVLNLSADRDYGYIYTSGLHREEIHDAAADVADRRHLRLASVIVRPYELEDDVAFAEDQVIPQVRFVYQLMDPRHPARALEQFYLHLNYDGVDRLAPPAERDRQHVHFLERVDALAGARAAGGDGYPEMLAEFIAEFTRQPVENLAFSSSLTGLWVFGALTTTNNAARALLPVRVVRDGVDVGYYSTVFDVDLFREAMRTSTDEARKARIATLLEDLTVDWYHDRKRVDPHALRFNRLTCAQCHHMAGRDAVHVARNDDIDRRLTSPERVSEYVYRELDRQLELGRQWWEEHRA
jgi:hypothetical protein